MRYKIGGVEVQVEDFFNGYYQLRTDNSFFTLAEKDFEIMAVELEDPKFHIGEDVFLVHNWNNILNFSRRTVEGMKEGNYLLSDELTSFQEEELYTTEEVIDMLLARERKR